MISTHKKKRIVNLALQGGGSHGAFTWGVLDRLLEEDSLEIEGISGTSAGAVNATLLAMGLVTKDKAEAKTLLDRFWKKVSQKSSLMGSNPNLESWFSSWRQPFEGAFSHWFEMLSHVFSPYDLNPLNYHPLKQPIEDIIDFECLRKTDKIKIYISATNVETNRIKVFDKTDLCLEALLASLCLPTVYQAVQWKNNFFWDGGFMGNPILEPLIYNCSARDLLIIQVNPIHKPGVPRTSQEILDRLNEITFNSSLMREIRTIINIWKLSEADLCQKNNPYAGLRLHCIQDEKYMATLRAHSKYNTNPHFLYKLKQQGRNAADQWLKQHLTQIGFDSTMDLSNWKLETPSTTCLTWGEKDAENI